NEDPAAVDRLVAQSGGGERHATTEGTSEDTWQRIAGEAKLGPTVRTALEAELKKLRDFLGLRETAKHHLMKGYALIRRIVVELDRRHGLDSGVFYLIPEELPRLTAREDMSAVIAERKRRRDLALGLELPQVLFSDDLEAIGRPVVAAGAESF